MASSAFTLRQQQQHKRRNELDLTMDSAADDGGGSLEDPRIDRASDPSNEGTNDNVATTAPPPVDGPGKVRFLLHIADRFEEDGNVSEAVKSAETGLLLRRSLPDDAQQMFSNSLSQQAADLVMKCNSLGVREFQRGAYALSEFLLSKALFLTEDAPTSNCFGGMEHDRLRLRAATCNNLGCMEKRRGQLEPALGYLHRAAELESLVDPDVGAAPSTQLNLCTLLNKMGKHEQAAAAAQRAVRTLLFQQQQQGQPVLSNMLLMAHYNLGVSHEFCGRPADIARARESYNACVASGTALNVDPAESPALRQSESALRRLEVSHPLPLPTAASQLGGLPPLPPSSLPPSASLTASIRGGAVVGSGRGSVNPASAFAAQQRALQRANVLPPATPSSATSSDNLGLPRTPRARQAPPQARGITTAPAGGSRDDALQRHRERIQQRQRRKDEAADRSQAALRRAQQAHAREKNDKLRQEQEEAARQREALAQVMYERMESGIRAERIRMLYEAARAVQKVWRGFLVRTHLRDMALAAIKLQSVYRSHLCRMDIRRTREREQLNAENRLLLRRQQLAAVVIQRRARQFLRRCRTVQAYRCRQLRRFHCARRIALAYRAYRQRVADRVLKRLEAERQAIQARADQLNEAARKIQTLYRSFKSRRFLRVVRQEQQRRHAAATKIQAAMRGSLTRSWFRHYRLYRRQQELSTAANLRSIVRLQCAWRVAIARRRHRQLALQKLRRDRLQRLYTSARRIQCGWRCHVARGLAGERRQAVQRRHAAASVIQQRWQAFQCRRRYLWMRTEARLQRALRRIQSWWRETAVRRRHVETAKYHAKMLRQERELLARTMLSLNLTSGMRFVQSSRLRQDLQTRYDTRAVAARTIQRVGRGHHGRVDVAATKRIAALVARSEEARRRANAAACVLQRAVRVFQAKETCNRKQRELWASVRIQCFWRAVLARAERRRLQDARLAALRDAAARKIQKSIRLHFKRNELRRLDAYYTARRRHKLLEQRRWEAATAIQAQWKGFATRRATAQARAELMRCTVQVIRIQRAWRTHRTRVGVNAEVTRRRRRRDRTVAAATKLQSFWRRILAEEYVALVRERHFNQTVASICIQCAWRRYAAVCELENRREIRRQLQRIAADRHDAWTLACVQVQATLRTRQDALNRLERLEESLAGELRVLRKAHATHLFNAATKIQAIYRGHYERCYARGLRAEARAKEMALERQRAVEREAATSIQCAYRSSVARRRAAAIQTERRQRRLEEEALEEERADPRSLVQSEFWAHEAQLKRNLGRERLERHERRTTAAVAMQRIVRGFVARIRFRQMVRRAKEQRSAASIQTAWRRSHKRSIASRDGQRVEAAILIQSVVRRFLVRCGWARRRDTLAQKKNANVRSEERRDEAATRVQAVWRGCTARRATIARQHERNGVAERRVQFEAARVVQKHVRRLLAINRVNILRYRKLEAARNAGPVPPPTAAPLRRDSNSEYRPESVGATTHVPTPPPRRTSVGVPPRIPRPPSGPRSRPDSRASVRRTTADEPGATTTTNVN